MNLTIFLDITQSISIVIASIVAIYGINSWRNEAKWKRKYELAEEILALVYDIKERFQVIRNPLSFTSEGKTRKRNPNESERDSETLDKAYVFIERFEKEKEPFIKLRSQKFRFMAVFGKEAAEPFDDINKLVNKIFNAAHRLGNHYWKQLGRREYTEKETEIFIHKIEKLEAILWADYNDTDPINQELDSIITKIEHTCRSQIEKAF